MTTSNPQPNSGRAVYTICNPTLPLAVYREVAAHLCQIHGIETELLPQTAEQFDYHQSQLGGLTIRYTAQAEPEAPQQVEQILAHYSDRHGTWQISL